MTQVEVRTDRLVIAGREFGSRLVMGTGGATSLAVHRKRHKSSFHLFDRNACVSTPARISFDPRQGTTHELLAS